MEVELRVLGPVDYHFHKQYDQWSLSIFTTSFDLHNHDPHPHLIVDRPTQLFYICIFISTEDALIL